MTAILIQALVLFRTVWAVGLALLVGSVLIVAVGADPLAAYGALFGGAFLDYCGLGQHAGEDLADPARRRSPWSCRCAPGCSTSAARGRSISGALFATAAALYLPELPGPVHIAVCALAGMAGGALWALFPGYLKAYHGINEVIVTLLMNYVAINIVSYLVSGPMMEEGAPYPYSPEIGPHLFLPLLLPQSDAHIGRAHRARRSRSACTPRSATRASASPWTRSGAARVRPATRASPSGARCCSPWRSAARSPALPAHSRSWA